MRLIDAVIMGRFCGLRTIDEAITNIELHYWQLLPSSEVNEARTSFYKEVQAYEEGRLTLDEDFIKSELAKMEEELKQRHFDETGFSADQFKIH